jgi:hypothetical protein
MLQTFLSFVKRDKLSTFFGKRSRRMIEFSFKAFFRIKKVKLHVQN